MIQITPQQAHSFRLVPKIIGKGAKKIQEIAKACNGKVRVRGRGSGHVEGRDRVEADVPLHVALSCSGRHDFTRGKELISSALDCLAAQYVDFCERQGHEAPMHFFVERDGRLLELEDPKPHPSPSSTSRPSVSKHLVNKHFLKSLLLTVDEEPLPRVPCADLLGLELDEAESTSVGAVACEAECTSAGGVTCEAEPTSVGAVTYEAEPTSAAECTGAGAVAYEAECTRVGGVTCEAEPTSVGAVTYEAEFTSVAAVWLNAAECTSVGAVTDEGESTSAGAVTYDAESASAAAVSYEAESTRAGAVSSPQWRWRRRFRASAKDIDSSHRSGKGKGAQQSEKQPPINID